MTDISDIIVEAYQKGVEAYENRCQNLFPSIEEFLEGFRPVLKKMTAYQKAIITLILIRDYESLRKDGRLANLDGLFIE